MSRGLALLALTTGLVALGGLPASAAEPERTAWFNALEAGPLVVPQPAVAEGDLRVQGTGARPTAYATLSLASPGTSGGELVLAVRAGSTLGTPEIAACPTGKSDWKEGGNQPFSAGPGYDCAAGVVFGTLSADGTSVSFPLDSSVQPTEGVLDIALAPLPETAEPFSIDLGDPQYTPSGDVPTAGGEEPVAEGPGAGEPAAPAAPAPGSGQAEGPSLPGGELDSGSAPAPEPLAEDAPAPELAGVDQAPAAPDAAPLPAPETVLEQPSAPTTVLPGARLAAGTDDVPTGPRLLALLTLIGVSAGAGYAAGQQRGTPRLIGGRARALPAAGPAAGGTLVVADREPEVQPRGIGRFSRVREAAPRRLR